MDIKEAGVFPRGRKEFDLAKLIWFGNSQLKGMLMHLESWAPNLIVAVSKCRPNKLHLQADKKWERTLFVNQSQTLSAKKQYKRKLIWFYWWVKAKGNKQRLPKWTQTEVMYSELTRASHHHLYLTESQRQRRSRKALY